MEATMNQIRSIIKKETKIEVKSSEGWVKDGGWTITLSTAGNKYPYWLRWEDDSIERGLKRCLAYLQGIATQPHGRENIPAQAWLRNEEGGGNL